jgi:hypothetical protein
MTNTEFIALVAQARSTQKIYFRTRDKSILEQSKSLERRIDAEISRIEQQELFERHCAQLVDLFLTFDNQKHTFASEITPYHNQLELIQMEFQSFEVANNDNTSRHRIIFAVEEV